MKQFALSSFVLVLCLPNSSSLLADDLVFFGNH